MYPSHSVFAFSPSKMYVRCSLFVIQCTIGLSSLASRYFFRFYLIFTIFHFPYLRVLNWLLVAFTFPSSTFPFLFELPLQSTYSNLILNLVRFTSIFSIAIHFDCVLCSFYIFYFFCSFFCSKIFCFSENRFVSTPSTVIFSVFQWIYFCSIIIIIASIEFIQ